MFSGLFKKKDDEDKNIHFVVEQLYACALLNTRKKIFYEECGVPDTFDGRFDLLLVHIFIILHIMMEQDDYEEISQALFDAVFRDMDQTLREMGIGDMGVPKHMKRMMKAFNGRMHSYQMAVAPESFEGQNIEGLKKTNLDEVLKRNLYGTVKDEDDWNDDVVPIMGNFIKTNIDQKTQIIFSQILNGHFEYMNVKKDK